METKVLVYKHDPKSFMPKQQYTIKEIANRTIAREGYCKAVKAINRSIYWVKYKALSYTDEYRAILISNLTNVKLEIEQVNGN